MKNKIPALLVGAALSCTLTTSAFAANVEPIKVPNGWQEALQMRGAVVVTATDGIRYPITLKDAGDDTSTPDQSDSDQTSPDQPDTDQPDQPDTDQPDTDQPDSDKPPAGGTTTPTTPSDPSSPSTPSGADTSVTIPVEAEEGTAAAELDQEKADAMVDEAVKNGSANVVLKVDAPQEASSVTVTIPAASVGNLSEKTDASLTVNTPLADVALSSAAVDQLAKQASESVTVGVARDGDKTTVSLLADGKDAGSVSGIKAVLPAVNAVSGTVVKLVSADGSETVVKKAVVKDDSVSVALNGTAALRVTDNSRHFTDTEGHWAAGSIDFVTSRELFLGTGDGSTFTPAGNMTRGMLATVLHRLENEPDASLDDLFSDVAADTWYTSGVAWAAGNGVIKGQGNGTFSPERDITRQELAVMLYNYAGYLKLDVSGRADMSGYSDGGDVAAWALDAMGWAVDAGIIGGTDTGSLNPGATATRGEVATMLERMIKIL